jgi:hypothetical protein
VCKRTDERDAIDKRVKEMWTRGKILSLVLSTTHDVVFVGEPEWGGRSSAGAVCKRTDER